MLRVGGGGPAADVEYHAGVAYDSFLSALRRSQSDLPDGVPLPDFFTDDAVIVDAHLGRVQGRAAIEAMLARSDVGFHLRTDDPAWTMIDGDWVVAVFGPLNDGVWSLRYAGDGRFHELTDLVTMPAPRAG